jgi:hypothetical protein
MNTNATTDNEIKTLAHNQEIRGAGFKYAQKITVGTIAGYAKEYNEDPAAAIARAVEFGHSLAPWANQSAAVLTANYAGKDEQIAKERAATSAAPELADGETVQIEGALFTVKLLGARYSDPIHFVAVK